MSPFQLSGFAVCIVLCGSLIHHHAIAGAPEIDGVPVTNSSKTEVWQNLTSPADSTIFFKSRHGPTK